MKKINLLRTSAIKPGALFSTLFLFGFFSAYSAAEHAGPGPQIRVSGSAKITAEADRATINLHLTTQAANSAAAKREVDERAHAFFAAVAKLGIADEQITAGSMNLSPQYDYQDRRPRFIGFQASRSVGVEVSDLEQLHPVLDAAVALKINGIQGISYASSGEDEMRQQARLAAIEDSKEKARQLADAYGARLGPVYSISYHSGSIERPRNQPGMKVLAMAESSSAGRFIPDEISVSDNINVVFDLITH